MQCEPGVLTVMHAFWGVKGLSAGTTAQAERSNNGNHTTWVNVESFDSCSSQFRGTEFSPASLYVYAYCSLEWDSVYGIVLGDRLVSRVMALSWEAGYSLGVTGLPGQYHTRTAKTPRRSNNEYLRYCTASATIRSTTRLVQRVFGTPHSYSLESKHYTAMYEII